MKEGGRFKRGRREHEGSSNLENKVDRQARARREVTSSFYDEAPYVLSPTCELSVS